VIGFRLQAQHPPPPRPVADGVVRRLEHVYEVDPALMQVTPQQDMPLWDTERIVSSRADHLAWMHQLFADTVISGEELLTEMEAEG
jgi:uncharacterized damage-inducible protein DinB